MPELTLHPETGKLVEVVQTYRERELSELEAAVNAFEGALAEKRQVRETRQAELDVASQAEAEAERELEDSKSTLVRGRELVGQPAEGVDPGTDGAGGEAAAPVESGENF